MRSATTGFFSTFASTKSLMRHRSSQRLKNVAASLYGPGPCDTVKAVVEQAQGVEQGHRQHGDLIAQVGRGPGGAAEEVVEAVEGVPLGARDVLVGVPGLADAVGVARAQAHQPAQQQLA